MRRSIINSAELFLLSAIVVLTGCDSSKPTGENKPLPPSQEIKTKNSKGNMVKDSLDDLPPPSRPK